MAVIIMAEGNSIENIKSVDGDKILSDQSIYAESFCFQDYFDDQATKRFIKNTEKTIRTSNDYKAYISQIKNVFILTKDNILSNITDSEASIELHHYPFSLYDIVDAVMATHILDDKEFTSFSLADEIMDLHFNHKIGLVPLSITTHELAHDGEIFLRKDQIFGQYEEFAKMYDKGIDVDLKEKLKKIAKETEKGAAVDPKEVL